MQNSGFLPWFLHRERFRTRFLLPREDPECPIPTLRSVVCLWGILFTPSGPWADRVHFHLSRALASIGHSFPSNFQQNALQLIQAHILLATYFYHFGHLNEGRYQIGAAAALALQCGLHIVRSARPSLLPNISMLPMQIDSPSTQGPIEEGERINGFWAVFHQDRIWAVASGTTTIIQENYDGGLHIDTPWPLDMEFYERGTIHPDLRHRDTLKNFLNSIEPSWPWDTDGILSQLSKASALFEHAARFSATPETSSEAHTAQLFALSGRIDEFSAKLLPLLHLSPYAVAQMHAVHCLTHGASIQLHAPFTQQVYESRAKCLDATSAILHANVTANVQGFPFINPIIGAIWATAGRVLINEITTSRLAVQYNQPLDTFVVEREAQLIGALNSVQHLLAHLTNKSPVMRFYSDQLQRERANL